MAPQALALEVMKLFRQSQSDQTYFDEHMDAINDHAEKLEKTKDALWKVKRQTGQTAADMMSVTRDVVNNDATLKANLKKLEEKITMHLQKIEETVAAQGLAGVKLEDSIAAQGRAVVANDVALKDNLRKLEETVTAQGARIDQTTAPTGHREAEMGREEIIAQIQALEARARKSVEDVEKRMNEVHTERSSITAAEMQSSMTAMGE